MASSLVKIAAFMLLMGVPSSTPIETALPPPQDVVAYANTLKVPPATDLSEEGAKRYLKDLDTQKSKMNNAAALAEWAYVSNITKPNLDQKLAVFNIISKFLKDSWLETIKFPWRSFQDEDVKRQFTKLSVLGAAALPPETSLRNEELIANMQNIYSTAKICDYQNRTKCDLSLEPELLAIMAKSRNPEELKYAWVEFRKQAGDKCKQQYIEYVDIGNQAARLNNQSDMAEAWLFDYESEDFRDQIQRLWEQLRPLYLQLHAFVRNRLRLKYGEDIVPRNGPIPAHILGNMWAQNWGNIFDIVTPFPGKKALDVTPAMIAQGYTPEKLFKMSEEFFTSLNLSAMPETFWERSILRKPENREIVCHASAFDFYDGKDFRIKQCATVSEEQLKVAHHEMGHIEYFLQYKEQPNVYREGANPGFHEAVGDVMALSVSTRKHLREVGLLEAGQDDADDDLNYLLNLGLEKLSFLPFAYLMDLWRWDVFKGKVTPDNYNCEWWKRRLEYQGLQPPVNRSEDNFDPGSKYHIVAGVPYIRYFVSYIIQFQFHRALCERAGQFDPENPERLPLHKCDIYRSTAAGNALKSMLRLGSSKKWPEAMERITGQRNMDATGLLQYFAPLQRWLVQENAKSGETQGWSEPPKYVCTKKPTPVMTTPPSSR